MVQPFRWSVRLVITNLPSSVLHFLHFREFVNRSTLQYRVFVNRFPHPACSGENLPYKWRLNLPHDFSFHSAQRSG